MSKNESVGNVVGEILKSLLYFVVKVVAIVLAWACKLVGLIFTRIGELIEKLVMK